MSYDGKTPYEKQLEQKIEYLERELKYHKEFKVASVPSSVSSPPENVYLHSDGDRVVFNNAGMAKIVGTGEYPYGYHFVSQVGHLRYSYFITEEALMNKHHCVRVMADMHERLCQELVGELRK